MSFDFRCPSPLRHLYLGWNFCVAHALCRNLPWAHRWMLTRRHPVWSTPPTECLVNRNSTSKRTSNTLVFGISYVPKSNYDLFVRATLDWPHMTQNTRSPKLLIPYYILYGVTGICSSLAYNSLWQTTNLYIQPACTWWVVRLLATTPGSARTKFANMTWHRSRHAVWERSESRR